MGIETGIKLGARYLVRHTRFGEIVDESGWSANTLLPKAYDKLWVKGGLGRSYPMSLGSSAKPNLTLDKVYPFQRYIPEDIVVSNNWKILEETKIIHEGVSRVTGSIQSDTLVTVNQVIINDFSMAEMRTREGVPMEMSIDKNSIIDIVIEFTTICTLDSSIPGMRAVFLTNYDDETVHQWHELFGNERISGMYPRYPTNIPGSQVYLNYTTKAIKPVNVVIDKRVGHEALFGGYVICHKSDIDSFHVFYGEFGLRNIAIGFIRVDGPVAIPDFSLVDFKYNIWVD